jgi:hypothetical protein
MSFRDPSNYLTPCATFRWCPANIARLECAASDCTWEIGEPNLVGGQLLRIVAEWSEEEGLSVAVEGFAALEPDATLQVGWLDGRREPVAQGCSAGYDPARLAGPRPPQSDDLLGLCYVRTQAEQCEPASEGPAPILWRFRIEVPFRRLHRARNGGDT